MGSSAFLVTYFAAGIFGYTLSCVVLLLKVTKSGSGMY